MNPVLIGLLCGFLAAGEEPKPAITTSKAPPKAPAAASSAAPDPVQQEYEKLVEQDEAAIREVQKMELEYSAFQAKGAAGPKAVLMAKIQEKLDAVKRNYDEFLQKHPKHVEALIAYASFLGEIDDEETAIIHLEKARAIEPKNPTPWNNLANIFGHIGPIKKAFQYYEKAIELDPTEAVYLHNLATVTYLFRKDAAETYRIDEEAVFNKSLDLYRRAMKLDPGNIMLATDYAQSYYGIKPLRVDDAITAWKHALTLAKSDVEKQGIYLHLARVELNGGKFNEAQQHLDLVQDPEMQELKGRLKKNLEKKKEEAKAANVRLERRAAELDEAVHVG